MEFAEEQSERTDNDGKAGVRKYVSKVWLEGGKDSTGEGGRGAYLSIFSIRCRSTTMRRAKVLGHLSEYPFRRCTEKMRLK